MNNKIKKNIKLFFLFLILLLSYFYIKNHLDEFKKILDLNFYQFIILSSLTFIGFLLNGYIFNTLLELFNVNLKIKEWFSLSILNNYSNYFLTKGGQVLRSIYLKKKHQFPYKNYILIFIFNNLLIIFSISLVVIFTSFFKFLHQLNFNFNLIIFFTLLSIITIIPFFLSKRILKFFSPKFKHWAETITRWIIIRHNKKIAIKIIFLTTLLIFWGSFRIFLIYKMLFTPILFSSALIIVSISLLSPFISITPAALGIREFVMSYAAKLAGEDFAIATAVATTDRVVSMIWVFILGSIISVCFYKKNSLE
ncbi:MAG: lysylphosphatidylglycerol synthase transmembrane domain-containing protein [Candidatus Helarchaeota archaeon]